MSNELATKQSFSLAPQSLSEAMEFARMMAESEMVPKQFRGKPGDVLVAVQMGNEVGMQPMASIQNIAVINGKPGIYGDAGKAILLANGCIIEEDDIAIVEKNARARCKITRPGRPPVERTFSLDNAKTAGLWNKEGPWRTHPWRQMAWRAFWFAARDAASDLLKGLSGAEELRDYRQTERDITSESQQVGATNTSSGLPIYSDTDFKKNLPAWRKLIAEGKKSADQIIATVSSKATLTEAQKAEIRGESNSTSGSSAQASDGGAGAAASNPAVTFAQVEKKLRDAKAAGDADLLDAEADLIGEIADEQQRKELSDLYRELRDQLSQ